MPLNLLGVFVALLALYFPAPSTCRRLYVMSSPSLLRVGAREKVLVAVHHHSGANLEVKISVLDFPKRRKTLLTQVVSLTKDNGFMQLADIEIPEGKDNFDKDDTVNQYVYLRAQFPDDTMGRAVLVSFQSGYIFVQTDKTIYTPSSTVLYRVFSLDPAMLPEESGIAVEIMNPDGITLTKDIVFPNRGIKSGEYKLSEVVSLGTWKVVTRFQNAPQKNFTAEFEVKEYVLPSFEVSLKTIRPFFYVHDEELTVDIVARYLYKKEVAGSGFVSFGVLTKENEKTNLASSLQRVEICDGKGKAVLKKAHITQTFPDINKLVGSSLYVTVSVLTNTGSEMVEAERRGIQIVQSPYTVHFKKMAKYFKPGMPYDVSVVVNNPDSSPASNIEVEVSGLSQTLRGTTKTDGKATVTINTAAETTELHITAKTKDPSLQESQQAQRSVKVARYLPPQGSNNYLHISVTAAELAIGEHLKVTFHIAGQSSTQNQDLTYMILSKGQIVQAKTFKRQGQALVTLSLPVTKDMIPSFRIVAYYDVGSYEVVSDSVWIDVKDTCMGTLKMWGSRPGDIYRPRQPFSLNIAGDAGARVGLVAVDKGVYVLNNKHRLTQSKIWDVVEKQDFACTFGSGQDSMWVFYDAGLVFQTSTGIATPERSSITCARPPKVPIRRVIQKPSTGSVVVALRREPMRFRMSNSPFRRTSQITAVQAPVRQEPSQPAEAATDDGDNDEDEFYIESEDIVSRSQFPESWLWIEEDLPECPTTDNNCSATSVTTTGYMKDSITSWQIMSISVSKTHGICVAEPYEMVVKKDFFIDLKLPYSAVRNEQIEVKAILYNYVNMKMKVRVELLENSDICSVATKKGKYHTVVQMDAMTSRAVPFIIIPMQLGKHTIEVKAAVHDATITDGVKKELLVVAEGVRSELQLTKVILNPSKHGGTQVEAVLKQLPRNQVPGTPAHTYFSLSGNPLSQTIEKAITGDSMGTLIVQPRGCGEQNMIYMTLPLIATHYLDTTVQWEKVGLEKRDTAIKYINMGYQQELAFRKPDGAFAVWADTPGSAWLTAYVAKVFAMASDLISVKETVICDALKWLVLNSQQPDGIFKETFNVYHGEMVGGVRGKDADASMTAFVLIAMQEGRRHCIESVASLPRSMAKAVTYLEARQKTLSNPYAVALVSYALANEEKLDKEILFKHAKDGTHWPVAGNHQFTLEATAYALLALVKAGEMEKAGRVVQWLNQQKFYGGGHGTTQSTIMVFQAVAEYTAKAKQQDQNLEVDIKVSGRSKPIKWTFTNSNAFLTRSDKIDLNQNLTVTASGTGEATLSVMTLYYAKPSEVTKTCKMFDFEVKLEKQNQVSYKGAMETYLVIITVQYLNKDRDATMSILDIGLLTGFSVDETDLTQLSTGADRYIQKFEMDTMLSERGSLIIYLDKISRSRPETIAFRIHKMMDVGLLQPAAISVYEYLDMEKRCVKFYHPVKKGGELNRICYKELCKCAEESCCELKTDEVMDAERAETACEPGIDYVYKVTVEEMDLTSHTDTYRIKIVQVIKEGTDVGVESQTREFVGHPNCRDKIGLRKGKSYMVMGHRDDVIAIEGSFRYLLGQATWLEYWPTEQEAQTPEYKDIFAGMSLLAHEVMTFGCAI